MHNACMNSLDSKNQRLCKSKVEPKQHLLHYPGYPYMNQTALCIETDSHWHITL